LTIKQNVLNAFLDTWVKTPDGTQKYLLKFDDDDLNEMGVNASTVTDTRLTQGVISYKEFKEKGFYQVRVNEDLRQTRSAALTAFLNETPAYDSSIQDWFKKANNINTQTGFYEIFSIDLVNYYRNFWYDAAALSFDETKLSDPAELAIAKVSQRLYPIAVYRPQPDGYEDTSANGYPLQYIDLHPHHRVHSQRTDNKNILELFDDVLFINSADAAVYGNLKTGDSVILTSSNGGKIMRRVSVTNIVMPGVIIGTEGSSVRHLDDEASEDVLSAEEWQNVIDYGGAANVLTASYLVGQAHQAYNTVIVKIEKAQGDLVPQYKWEPDLPTDQRTVVVNHYK
jgi:anaerobic selenocysteine-containing dehydrogenase